MNCRLSVIASKNGLSVSPTYTGIINIAVGCTDTYSMLISRDVTLPLWNLENLRSMTHTSTLQRRTRTSYPTTNFNVVEVVLLTFVTHFVSLLACGHTLDSCSFRSSIPTTANVILSHVVSNQIKYCTRLTSMKKPRTARPIGLLNASLNDPRLLAQCTKCTCNIKISAHVRVCFILFREVRFYSLPLCANSTVKLNPTRQSDVTRWSYLHQHSASCWHQTQLAVWRHARPYLHRHSSAVDVLHKWQRDVMTYLHRVAVAVDEMLGAVWQAVIKTPMKMELFEHIHLWQPAASKRRLLAR